MPNWHTKQNPLNLTHWMRCQINTHSDYASLSGHKFNTVEVNSIQRVLMKHETERVNETKTTELFLYLFRHQTKPVSALKARQSKATADTQLYYKPLWFISTCGTFPQILCCQNNQTLIKAPPQSKTNNWSIKNINIYSVKLTLNTLVKLCEIYIVENRNNA